MNKKQMVFGSGFALLISVGLTRSHSLPDTVPGNTMHQFSDTALPECIKKLSGTALKGPRTSGGLKRYTRKHILPDGKAVYAFTTQPAIGCHINDPASTKYYSDSCKLVASFPSGFTLKKSFKPFVAAGYNPGDFPEANKGDYPAYFANYKPADEPESSVAAPIRPNDQFAKEKTFLISSVEDNVFQFAKNDVIRISTKNGLKHYRAGKLLNTYKIIPQLSLVPLNAQCRVPPCEVTIRAIVYHAGHVRRYIDIRHNNLYISTSEHLDAADPTDAIKLIWKKAYTLSKRSG